MGTRTDAAHAQVIAARADLDDQVDRLEAAGRAAVDIPAKVRANPAKAAGVAGGGAFLALGGPKRLFRRAKRAITGKEEELPSELLPKEVEKTLRKLGTDGKAGPRDARARVREATSTIGRRSARRRASSPA